MGSSATVVAAQVRQFGNPRARLCLVPLVLVLVLCFSQAASAATVTRTGGAIFVTPTAGEANDMLLSVNPDKSYRFTDAGAPLAQSGCVSVSTSVVDCDVSNIVLLTINTGDMNDKVKLDLPTIGIGAPGALVTTGTGNDTITGSPTSDALLDGGPDNDVINGGDGSDVLDGGTGADKIDGQDGIDQATYWSRTNGVIVDVQGDDGDDGEGCLTGAGPLCEGDSVMNVEGLVGGAGDDSLALGAKGGGTSIGGEGDNKFTGSPEDDRYIGGHDQDQAQAGLGFDTVDYSSRTEDLTIDFEGQSGVRSEHDSLTGFDRAIGGSGDDYFHGNIYGQEFVGGPGADTFEGGPGEDTVDYSDHVNSVSVTSGDGNANDGNSTDGPPGDRDQVGADVESVVGTNLADTISSGPGNGTVHAGAGNDWIDTGDGSDVVFGGPGTDTVDYSSRDSHVSVGIDELALDGEIDADPSLSGNQPEDDALHHDLENLVGTSGDDELWGDDGNNVINAGTGDDIVSGRGGNDLLDGGDGSDAVSGNDGNDLVLDGLGQSGSGQNELSGGTGDDLLGGGTGDDLLQGGAGADVMIGGAGIDSVDYSNRLLPITVSADGNAGDGESGENDNVAADVESASGGAGDDSIHMGAGNGAVDGGAGDDTLDGGADADALTGGPGRDTASYASRTAPVSASLDGQANDGEAGEGDLVAGDVEDLEGGTGPDQLVGDGSANHLQGNGGDDSLDGGAGYDLLEGGSGADTLQGGDQPDSLAGGEGDDKLLGGAGDDDLAGEAGNDSLDGQTGGDSLSGGEGIDLADYGTRGTGVRATNDGAPDDGESGEGDTLRSDVESTSTGSGADTIDVADGTKGSVTCGASTDTVIADRSDQIAGDCEGVTRVDADGKLLLSQSTVTMSRRGAVKISVGCPGAFRQGCKGKVVLSAKVGKKKKKSKPVAIGSNGFRIAGGRSASVEVELSSAARRVVKSKKRLAANLVADLGSGQTSVTRRITIKAAKGKTR